jgi:hypothetical protein
MQNQSTTAKLITGIAIKLILSGLPKGYKEIGRVLCCSDLEAVKVINKWSIDDF